LASEFFVSYLFLIDGIAAVALLVIWYACWALYNRRKAAKALRWIEAASSGRGQVIESRWTNFRRLQAQVRFAPHWFENARVIVQLLPRPIPIRWLLSIWKKERETLTFEADLDYAPGFRLDLFRQRWVTHKHIRTSGISQNWSITRPGPVVLTTRPQWTQELTPVVNTLMTSRGHNLISVRFHPSSPHLAATIDLESLSNQDMAAGFLEVLRELAAGASTAR
jgi:hypothetical protein